jgi:hypothetical protein
MAFLAKKSATPQLTIAATARAIPKSKAMHSSHLTY